MQWDSGRLLHYRNFTLNCLHSDSIQCQVVQTEVLFLPNHARLCPTNWRCSNRPAGGAQGTSQQQKCAKPRTASPVVLLSHSSLGLPKRTGLGREDRHLATNWHHHVKSHFHHAGHAARQLLWDKLDRQLQNERVRRAFSYMWAHISIYLYLSQIYYGLIFSKGTSKPTYTICSLQEIKNHQKIQSAAINRICSVSPPVQIALIVDLDC